MRYYTLPILPLFIVLLTAPLGGCATATRGTFEMVQVNTVPEGAQVTTDLISKTGAAYSCSPTPCSLNLPRRSSPIVTVSKNGFQSIQYKLVSTGATSAASIKIGSVVSGREPGSRVVVGKPEFLRRIPGGYMALSSVPLTMGIGTAIDYASGATLTLSPNPVTVFLAPIDRPTKNEAEQ